MDQALFERLLGMQEDETLDFKEEQYPFVGASDDQKSELLKDILAFANAWRQTDAYIQPQLVKPVLAEDLHSHSLRIVTWLFNQGRETADDVVVVLQETPVGVLGLNYENWNLHRTAYPGTVLALKQPLNPGGRVFLCSVTLGVARFEGQQGQDQALVVEHDNVDFKIKILARNQTPVDLAVSYNRAEMAELVCKKYSSG
jgi:hypothetical protein